jgi:hypothetical protein
MDGIINDKAAALHGICFAVGAISAPFIVFFPYRK